MTEKFDESLVEVWKQSLVEDKSAVTLGGKNFAVTATAQKRLKQVEFQVEGRAIRGIEQNPATKSRWAKMAKSGKRGDAVHREWDLCGCSGGRKSLFLRQGTKMS